MQFKQYHLKTIIKGLYVITDTKIQNRYTHAELAKLAISGGANVIQYRSKNCEINTMIKEAIEVKIVCDLMKTPLIINDSIDVCLAVKADGVHLGASDIEVKKAREILGENSIIGETIRNSEQAKQAILDGADYLGLGPVNFTKTKDVNSDLVSIETINSVVQIATIPIILISGINIENASRFLSTGVDGIAVVSAICTSNNVYETTKKFSELFRI